MIEQAVAAEKALLIYEHAAGREGRAALKALVDPAVEQLGGDEVVSDYEVEVPEEARRGAAPSRRRGRGGRSRAGGRGTR